MRRLLICLNYYLVIYACVFGWQKWLYSWMWSIEFVDVFFLVSCGTRYVHQLELRWLYSKGSLRRSVSQRRRCEPNAAGFNSHQKTPGWIWECWESRVHFNLHFPLVRNEDHKQQIYDFALKIERPKWNMVPWRLTNKVKVLPGCLKLFWIPNSGNLSFEQLGACFLNNAYSMETTSAAIAIRSPLLEIASCNKKVVTCTGVGFKLLSFADSASLETCRFLQLSESQLQVDVSKIRWLVISLRDARVGLLV